MHHTWTGIFFCIVMCFPVVAAAEDPRSLTKKLGEDAAFRDCVLKQESWEKECFQNVNDADSLKSPYNDIFKSVTSPPKVGIWNPTPSELFRKRHFSDTPDTIRGQS